MEHCRHGYFLFPFARITPVEKLWKTSRKNVSSFTVSVYLYKINKHVRVNSFPQ